MKLMQCIGVVLVLLLAPAVSAEKQIVVKGLFKNMAVVLVDGQQYTLKVGKTSPTGIKLLSADSKKAVIEIDGERRNLGVDTKIGANYSQPKSIEVRIASAENGHYFSYGKINGHAVTFIVDTGASMISMDEPQATKLAINYKSGEQIQLGTANGVAIGYVVNLRSVSVGNITLENVRAVVSTGSMPGALLLGNSFLSRLNMNIDQGVLVLKTKY